jgi:putative membrane protein
VPFAPALRTLSREKSDLKKGEPMTYLNRFALAAGLAALLPLAGQAQGSGAGTGAGTGAATGRETEGSPPEASPGDERTTLQGGQQTDTAGTGSTAEGTVSKDLQERLQKLHATNQAEVQMGQMGAQTAQSDQVKEFAQKMVDTHQQSDQKLQQMAQQLGVQLTGKEFESEQKNAEKAMQKVHGKSGSDFDKALMSQMVKDHEKAAKDTSKAATEARQQKQTELASFLEQTHQGIQGHLEEAKQLEKSVKSSARTTGGTPSGTGSGTEGSEPSGAGSTGESGGEKPSPGGGY